MIFNRVEATTSYGSAAFDAGLRTHFAAVYKHMCVALSVTGLVSFGVSTSQALMSLFYTMPFISIVFMAALIGLSFFMNAKVHSLSTESLQACLLGYSGIMGLALAPTFIIYTGVSIVKVFFLTAATFGGTSIYGYTTKRDLTSVGSFLRMGMWGLLAAIVVNLFLKSSAMDFIISVVGVGVFVGIAAVNTQKIKENYISMVGYNATGSEIEKKVALMSSLNLYLDFINIFMYMLRLFGDRRRD